MQKYPMLQGRQCKMCKSKAELPEIQVLIVIHEDYSERVLVHYIRERKGLGSGIH